MIFCYLQNCPFHYGLCEYACCFSLEVLDDFCNNGLLLSSASPVCIGNSHFSSFTHELNHRLLNTLHPHPNPTHTF